MAIMDEGQDGSKSQTDERQHARDDRGVVLLARPPIAYLVSILEAGAIGTSVHGDRVLADAFRRRSLDDLGRRGAPPARDVCDRHRGSRPWLRRARGRYR